MDLSSISLTEVYESFGYGGLLLYGWLGIIGLPLPNEVIVMTNGWMAGRGIFHPVLAFIFTYFSVISVIIFSFLVGKMLSNSSVIQRRVFKKSRNRIEKYGKQALTLSVAVPGLRFILPCAAGLSGFTYKDLFIYSLVPNFLWCVLYFTLGFYYFDKIDFREFQAGIFFGAAFFILIILIIQRLAKRKNLQEN